MFTRFSDPAPGFVGNFSITPSTRVIETVPAGSTTIIVDSTVGFSKTGFVVVNGQTITYTDKTTNQFLGCSGINSDIQVKSILRTNDVAYANDSDGNRVEFRLTGFKIFLPKLLH